MSSRKRSLQYSVTLLSESNDGKVKRLKIPDSAYCVRRGCRGDPDSKCNCGCCTKHCSEACPKKSQMEDSKMESKKAAKRQPPQTALLAASPLLPLVNQDSERADAQMGDNNDSFPEDRAEDGEDHPEYHSSACFVSPDRPEHVLLPYQELLSTLKGTSVTPQAGLQLLFHAWVSATERLVFIRDINDPHVCFLHSLFLDRPIEIRLQSWSCVLCRPLPLKG
jgi:hypothetical protein